MILSALPIPADRGALLTGFPLSLLAVQWSQRQLSDLEIRIGEYSM